MAFGAPTNRALRAPALGASIRPLRAPASLRAGRAVAAVLLLRLPLIASSYKPISRPAETRLHTLGRTAVHEGNHDVALQCYEVAAHHGQEGRSYFLLALHYQRCQAPPSLTRSTFRGGVAFE